MLATGPLDAGSISQISPAKAPFGDAAYSFYIGRIHGGRLIFNGIDRASQMTPGDDLHLPSLLKLEREMRRRFPALREAPVAAAWGGGVLQTRSDAPIVRAAENRSGVILNIGYGGGSGVGMALLSGRLTADLVLSGGRPDPDAERLRRLFAQSTGPGIGLYSKAAFSLLRHLFSSL
jgi:glycine/D-amino acid oxidase-like deaminating enzyme